MTSRHTLTPRGERIFRRLVATGAVVWLVHAIWALAKGSAVLGLTRTIVGLMLGVIAGPGWERFRKRLNPAPLD